MTGVLELTIGASLVALTVSFLLSLLRMVKGPSLADRAVAVDLMAALAIGIMAVTAIALESSALLQPALVLAFVAFLATVAFARYIEKAGADDGEGE